MVAVEDDEVEVVELLLEQLAGGEGDQGKFAHRRAVLLLGRAQDGEVHQIHRWVGLQEVAPDPLSGMGHAGNQKHAKPVADAVDDHRGAVVRQRQLALDGRDLELEDIGPAMFDLDLEGLLAADGEIRALPRPAVAADEEAGGRARRGTRHVLDADDHLDAVADDTVSRRLLDHQAAVPRVARAAQQHMERPVERELLGALGRVVNLAVGDHDDTGEPLRRHLGQHPAERRKQPRPLFRRTDLGAVTGTGTGLGPATDAKDAHFDVVEPGQCLAQMVKRRLGVVPARTHRLARRVIDDDDGDIGKGFAFLLLEGWVQ